LFLKLKKPHEPIGEVIAMKKIKLKRVKYLGDKPNAPDYTGFIRTDKGFFKIIGYIDNNTSDLDLTFKKLEINNLNKWKQIEFNKWLLNNQNNQ
jgi:hypothetical protein